MGFFSWLTQDTQRSIPNIYSKREMFPVWLVDPRDGRAYYEDFYEGYGIFGGVDFYALLAEINNLKPVEDDPEGLRLAGIRKAYSGEKYLSPLLLEDPRKWHAYVGEAPEACPNQGFFYVDEDTLRKETIRRIARGDVRSCTICGAHISADAPRYLHRFTDEDREWLCPDCAAKLLGESLNENNTLQYFN